MEPDWSAGGSVEKRVNEIRELPRPQGQPTPMAGWH